MKKDEIKNMDDFAKYVHDKLKEFLPEDQYVVSVNKETTPSILISGNGGKVVLRASLMKLYEDQWEGADLDSMLREIALDHRSNVNRYADSISQIAENFGRIKDRIYLEPVGVRNNREALEDVPHRKIGDVAAVYVIRKKIDEKRAMRVTITNDMLRKIGIPESKLYEIALENSERDRPPVLHSLDGIIKNEMPEDFDPSLNTGLYILSNKKADFGAAVLFYPDVLIRLERMFPEGFYVLPSSIHECLILPKKDAVFDLNTLSDMVREINENVVIPEERLSDFAHEYDAKKKTLVADTGHQDRLMEIDRTEDRTGRTH